MIADKVRNVVDYLIVIFYRRLRTNLIRTDIDAQITQADVRESIQTWERRLSYWSVGVSPTISQSQLVSHARRKDVSHRVREQMIILRRKGKKDRQRSVRIYRPDAVIDISRVMLRALVLREVKIDHQVVLIRKSW